MAYFAKKHDMTTEAAQALIERIGNDRTKLDAAAAESLAGEPSKNEDRAKKAASKATRRQTRGPQRAVAEPIITKPTPIKTRARRAAAPASAAAGVASALANAPAVARRSARQIKQAVIATPARAGKAATGKAVAPVTGRVGDAARSIADRARRGSAAARKSMSAAPAAVSKGATRAVKGAKSAATSRTAALVGFAAAGVVAGLAINFGRKAVVQAPSLIAGDWLEAIKVEHQLALTILDQIKETRADEPAKRGVLLAQLTHALGKHAFMEENVVYPALREWGDKADADKLNHDHGYVKQHLYELDSIEKDSAAFLAKIVDFRTDLEAHIAEEEQAIFPPLHAALGEAGNARITALANKEGFKLA